MISLHDASPLAGWWLPAAWSAMAVLLVWCCVRWRRGRWRWALPALGVAAVLAVTLWTWTWSGSRAAPAPSKPRIASRVLSPESQAVWAIVVQRCQVCHSDHATRMTWARYGLSLDTMDDVERNAGPIYKQVVELRGMPMGNSTQMTAEERDTIARWYAARRR